jgi:TetR/AcrR family transcriptional regulator, regulator of cefoperazone and chloramphenicol sensitivity
MDANLFPTAPASDKGERARTRLLMEALRIFAEKGYAKASTREICQAAGLNVAAIHYHFGDKEGLYRATLLGPILGMSQRLGDFDAPTLTLAESLHRLLGPFTADGCSPMRGTQGAQGVQGTLPPGAPSLEDGMRLYLREMIEPTPVFAQTVAQHIGPVHGRIARLLARHIGLAAPDEDIHRLVFGLIAMAHDYCMSREFMQAVAPRVLAGPDAIERARDRLVDWGVALVAHERKRRGLESPN